MTQRSERTGSVSDRVLTRRRLAREQVAGG